MIEKNKVIFIVMVMYLVFAAVCLAVGFRLGCAHSGTGSDDSERAERYEERSESAEIIINGIEDGLGTVAEQMHGAGEEIKSGITDVGELSSVGDRIAGASTDIAESAGRIEERIQRIESILSEAEEKNRILENSSDYIDPGGGY